MSRAGSQLQIFLRLLAALQPHWHRDQALPARLQTLLARHKEFGSRDRRLYRELLYTTLRYLPWIEPLLAADATRAGRIIAWLAAETRDSAAYRQEICGDWPTLPTVAARAAFLGATPETLLPAWLRAECPAAFTAAELEAQLARAPLWLRLQTDAPDEVAREFAAHQWSCRPAAILPDAWQVLGEVDVTRSAAYARGAIEIQDLGSQLVLASIGVAPGTRWFDACAGAGGKTLQLARLVGPHGAVDAHDIRPAALAELRARVSRAGLSQVRTVAVPASPAYDGVLVDAPCSGSGTWRRAPHLKWTTSRGTLADRAALQLTLLERYAGQVRPGGQLVYATCSLARTENAGVVTAFLARHPEFSPAAFANAFGFHPDATGLTILPSRHDTDGFFVAHLRRQPA
ncbi:RsmB/NOP family class I SAM-dependent RNA methyltransferase [Opitutus sp. ER46]|uniref:RsmB/NOP family class I SAM-dependent RNA methyltransferase n=1 Tax=Opitutus sp. ER46 TaxID=2161864 RepID=UPI000D305230|nr:RsmB/NOP family class I SAM-dependent RNA methyltransferase [Opitutus sp. ER46]PTX94568.1 RNA methyltransferase [Opitutus sp. ER46]